jgi:hypothetical protein
MLAMISLSTKKKKRSKRDIFRRKKHFSTPIKKSCTCELKKE